MVVAAVTSVIVTGKPLVSVNLPFMMPFNEADAGGPPSPIVPFTSVKTATLPILKSPVTDASVLSPLSEAAFVAAVPNPKLVREVAALATSDKLAATCKKAEGAKVNWLNKIGSVPMVVTVAVSSHEVFAFAVPVFTAMSVPG